MAEGSEIVSNAEAPGSSPEPATPTAETLSEGQTKAAEEAIKEIRKLKLKVDGEEQELPEDEVIRYAQMGKSANKRFEEAARMRKEVEHVLQVLQNDPRQVLRDPNIGVKLRQAVEQQIWEELEEQRLSPEQKQRKDLEREVQRYKEAEEQARAAQVEQQKSELVRKYEQDYEKTILATLESGRIPKTKDAVRRMAYYMEKAQANDIDLSPQELTELIRKDYVDEHKALYSAANDEQLFELMGEETAKKIRTYDLKRLKNTQTGFKASEPKTFAAEKKKDKRLTGTAWREQLLREAGFGKKRG